MIGVVLCLHTMLRALLNQVDDEFEFESYNDVICSQSWIAPVPEETDVMPNQKKELVPTSRLFMKHRICSRF